MKAFVLLVSVQQYLVGVPQANGTAQRQLPHQQIIHPAESKLQILHLTLLKVHVDILCGRREESAGGLYLFAGSYSKALHWE